MRVTLFTDREGLLCLEPSALMYEQCGSDARPTSHSAVANSSLPLPSLTYLSLQLGQSV